MITPEETLQALGEGGASAMLGGAGASTEELRAVLFNGAIEPRALAIVRPADEQAVRDAMAFASREGLSVAVVGGGHDMHARAFRGDNLIIDMSLFKSIEFDPRSGDITLGGGVLAGEMLEGLPDDRAAVIGGCLTVGMTAFAMGGGYGPLNAKCGLLCDGIRNARVVLPDGTVAIASEDGDSELFWAIRGGGTGFGVVTSITLATFAIPRVLRSVIMVGIDGAAAAVRAVQEAIEREPVDLSVFMAFMRGPDGEPGLMAGPLWTGGESEGEAALDRLLAETGGQEMARNWTPYRTSFDPEAEKLYPKGDGYHLVSRNVRRLDDAVIGKLVEAARALPSDKDFIIVHDFHGTACTPAPDATAFALRDDHFMIEFNSHWVDGDGADHRRWAIDSAAALGDLAMPGGYPALLSPEEADRTMTFYGANAGRLRRIKQDVDPRDMLRSAVGRLDPAEA